MFPRSATAVAVALCLGPAAFAADSPPVPIGSSVKNLTFKDIRYLVRSLDDFPDAKAFALIFTDTTCPLASRYWPTLRRLDQQYRGRGGQFLAANVGPEDSIVQRAA